MSIKNTNNERFYLSSFIPSLTLSLSLFRCVLLNYPIFLLLEELLNIFC